MIKIDEIYDTIFLQWLQQNRSLFRLFFCDPPGSTSPMNLFNYAIPNEGKIINNRDYAKEKTHLADKNYYFFHDQEPIWIDIHKPLFDTVIEKNLDLLSIYTIQTQPASYIEYYFNNSLHTQPDKASQFPEFGYIIISEQNSIFAEQLQDHYNWKICYYFYHGWAALDWYRGYNRTFLIPRAKHRTPTKSFISPNRIIGGKRDHRVLFLYHVFKNKLDNNHFTAPIICPHENTSITDVAKKYMDTYPDIIDVFNNASLPRLFKDEETQLMTSHRITNHDESADSLFYVPTETVYFGRRWHLTEKTFKPIVLEMPFILVAPMGSLEYLRSYGFKTFANIIDESYDEESNDILRLEKITNLLKDIDSLSAKERQQIHRHCLPLVEYNYNHFYFGNFEKILWNELTGMMQEWL